MNRRQFLLSTAAAAATLSASSLLQAQSKPATTQSTLPDNLAWHNVQEWGLEGRAFNDTDKYFDRLPARAKDVVRKEVWYLSHDTSGMSVRFRAATPALYVRYELTKSNLAMPHMPATGVSGVDLYAKREEGWHYLSTLFPKAQQVEGSLFEKRDVVPRDYQINFPLYNGVKSFEIGVPKDATFEPVAPRKEKPIVFYGTSITQGGCASRPGMMFTHILGRRLDVPMLNFGFSGNGRMEAEVAKFLAEIDARVFVLNCMENMPPEGVVEKTTAVVKLLKEAHPEMPILLLSERPYDDIVFNRERAAAHARHIKDFKQSFDELTAAGVKGLHYQGGEELTGTDGDGTVDGSHPTDLGMTRYADVLEPVLKKILRSTNG